MSVRPPDLSKLCSHHRYSHVPAFSPCASQCPDAAQRGWVFACLGGVHLTNRQLLSQEISKIFQSTNHSKRPEQKRLCQKTYGPERPFYLVASSWILYNTHSKISSGKAIWSTILHIYAAAVCYVVCQQSYLCCTYFTITSHHYFHNVKKVLIIFILMSKCCKSAILRITL